MKVYFKKMLWLFFVFMPAFRKSVTPFKLIGRRMTSALVLLFLFLIKLQKRHFTGFLFNLSQKRHL